jgi:hypothetical protein
MTLLTPCWLKSPARRWDLWYWQWSPFALWRQLSTSGTALNFSAGFPNSTCTAFPFRETHPHLQEASQSLSLNLLVCLISLGLGGAFVVLGISDGLVAS